MSIDRDRVKKRYLQQLNAWLNDGLVYYAFTGELVYWHYALNEEHRKLLERAAEQWPERLYRIEQSRKAK